MDFQIKTESKLTKLKTRIKTSKVPTNLTMVAIASPTTAIEKGLIPSIWITDVVYLFLSSRPRFIESSGRKKQSEIALMSLREF